MYPEIFDSPDLTDFYKQHKVKAVLEAKEYISIENPAILNKYHYVVYGFSDIRYCRLTFILPNTEERLIVTLPVDLDQGLEVGRAYYVCSNPFEGATAVNNEVG